MWRLFWIAFGTIFLAELGDKTQLAIFSMAASKRSPIPVFLGASIAMVLSTLIASFLGSAFGHFVPERVTRYIAGGVFIIFGILMISGKL